jgi:threonylcarbamoyladenosine tRNA methylthiotransferase MtaB
LQPPPEANGEGHADEAEQSHNQPGEHHRGEDGLDGDPSLVPEEHCNESRCTGLPPIHATRYTEAMTAQVEKQPVPRGVGPPLRSVAVLTLGCKLNQAESDAIARELTGVGCVVFDRPAAADAFIINSCSVTHVADRKSRHLVRLARRLAPDATVLLTGCFPETVGMDAALAVGADIVVPSRDKAEVVRRLLAHRPAAGGEQRPATGLRTRAFVKAQEGCNDVCAFCIVPRTRGRERSFDPAEVAAIVRQREEDGAQEVVITGTQLGAYGRDLDSTRYGPAAVIRTLLAETSVPRIRFSSLQPQDINPDLLALWEDPRLCRHFHLALQSGSETVLRRMRRRYSTAEYRRALDAIRATVPEVAITTDVLVGFPAETEAEHAESLNFCAEAGFAQMHVFPYSRRPGTTANVLTGHVPQDVKRLRMRQMLEAAEVSAAAFRRRYLGQTMPVLWEQEADTTGELPLWEGLTDNYIRVTARSPHNLRNRLLPVRLAHEGGEAIEGELLSTAS